MRERNWWQYIVGVFVVTLPVYLIFGIGLVLLPASQWISALIIAGIFTLTLVGCSIGGGYDSGCIWHYHGTPENISRPDIDSLRSE